MLFFVSCVAYLLSALFLSVSVWGGGVTLEMSVGFVERGFDVSKGRPAQGQLICWFMAALCYSKASGNLAPPVLSFLRRGAIQGANAPPPPPLPMSIHKHFKMDADQTLLQTTLGSCSVVSCNVLQHAGYCPVSVPFFMLHIQVQCNSHYFYQDCYYFYLVLPGAMTIKEVYSTLNPG